jgi:predicted RNase H-like HicB family nuclease
MVPNSLSTTLPQSATVKLHILLDFSAQGQAIASILELPNCQVEAPTREQALENLKKLLQTRLAQKEIIPLEIQLPQSETENPWLKFAGVFKDDPDFAEIAETLRAERSKIDDDLDSDEFETDLGNKTK